MTWTPHDPRLDRSEKSRCLYCLDVIDIMSVGHRCLSCCGSETSLDPYAYTMTVEEDDDKTIICEMYFLDRQCLEGRYSYFGRTQQGRNAYTLIVGIEPWIR